MPGPISDSYDPEFSTGACACIVREAIQEQADRITKLLGEKLMPIVGVVEDDFEHTSRNSTIDMSFTERELRIIRFSLNRAIASI